MRRGLHAAALTLLLHGAIASALPTVRLRAQLTSRFRALPRLGDKLKGLRQLATRVAAAKTVAPNSLPVDEKFDAPVELAALNASLQPTLRGAQGPSRENNPWSKLREFTTPEEVAEVHRNAEI